MRNGIRKADGNTSEYAQILSKYVSEYLPEYTTKYERETSQGSSNQVEYSPKCVKYAGSFSCLIHMEYVMEYFENTWNILEYMEYARRSS